MGLIEIVLAGLCFNCTGSDYDVAEDVALQKRLTLMALADDLKGKQLSVTTFENRPLSYVDTENGNLIGKGIAFDFLDILQEKFQFNYTISLPNSPEEVNGTGIFGMLNQNMADLAAGFISVMPSYWEYVRYSRSLDIGQWVVMMKRPKESASGTGLLAPFTFQVWMLVLLSLVVVGPTIYLMIKLEAKIFHVNEEENKTFPMTSCIWFVYGALLKQGSVLSPTTDSSRLLFSTWWIFITILTAFYTANLTAFLTLSKFTLQIQTAADIGQKKSLWVSHKGSPLEESLIHEQEMANNFKGSIYKLVDESSRAIFDNYVKKENYMYIGERPIVDHLMYDDYMSFKDPTIAEVQKCAYVVTNWAILTRPRAFAYSKSFKYHELFDSILQHLIEAGIVKHRLSDGLPNTQICPLDLGNKEKQLQNSDLIMTYNIVGVGFIIALLIFIGELIFNHYHFKKKDLNLKFMDKRNNQMLEPPSYHSLFFKAPFIGTVNSKKEIINGREYWVVNSKSGSTRLVPIRAPSSVLYQYTQ